MAREFIKEYIIEMSHIVMKIKTLKIYLSENALVHLVLNSLLAQFKVG